ncbi:hypothetical protein JCM8097_006379 [Rhodosporidiobolus ruineniae]
MPPRKSARTSKKKVQDPDEDYDALAAGLDDEDAAEFDEDFKPPAKKAKASGSKASKAKGKGKGRKSKLQAFNTMPLDVLATIMMELDTKTVLAMSRTCSAFRSLLHSSQSGSIWKASRLNTVGKLPELQGGDLKDWEYASLVFDSTCHVCHKTRAPTVDYALRARGCAVCMRGNSLQRSKMYEHFSDEVYTLAPESHWGLDFTTGQPLKFFWVPTLRHITKRLEEIQGKPDELKAYVAAKKQARKFCLKDSSAIKAWEARRLAKERNEKENAGFNRRRKLKAKFMELGYTVDELYCDAFEEHSLVNQPRDLTELIWKKVKDPLIAVLEEERARRAQREAARLMKARADALEPFYDGQHNAVPSGEQRSLFPPFNNWLMLDAVRPFWEPKDAEATMESMTAARTEIMAQCRAFGIEIKEAFFSRLLKAYEDAAASSASSAEEQPTLTYIDRLAKLVTSAVPCPSCRNTCAIFPDILDHFKACRKGVLTEDSLTTSPERIASIKHILETVNKLDFLPDVAETSSTADLYAIGKVFQCDDCKAAAPAFGAAHWSTAYSANREMSWSEMVDHIFLKHRTQRDGLILPKLEVEKPEPVEVEAAAADEEGAGGFFEGEEGCG